MEQIGMYLVKMGCWLASFLLVYHAFLRKETFFELNRKFLNAGLILSLVFPFVPITYKVTLPEIGLTLSTTTLDNNTVEVGNSILNWEFWLMFGYIVGMILFLFRLLYNVKKLRAGLKNEKPLQINGVDVYKLEPDIVPFSFFKKVVISKHFAIGDELKIVVEHEKVHINQKHWIDLILLELVCMLQWFNPLSYLYSRAVRQNHEYLADKGTLNVGINPMSYRAILANQFLGVQVFRLSNSFYSFNSSKRISMMNKNNSKSIKRLNILWIAPFIALLIYAFAVPELALPVNNTFSAITENTKVKGLVLDEKGHILHGASVIIKNTTNGTITDKKGQFELMNVPLDGEIAVSFVGFKSISKKVTESNFLTFKLERDVVLIDIVTDDAIKKGQAPPPPPPPPSGNLSTSNTSSQLSGIDNQTNEVAVQQNDTEIKIIGYTKNESIKLQEDKANDNTILITPKMDKSVENMPASGSNNSTGITINGRNYSHFNSKPLFVINNQIKDFNLNQIDPKLISSINVIKDQAAIDKYGEKGINGVIEITTKKNDGEASTLLAPPPPPPPPPLKKEGDNNANNTDETEVFIVVEEMPEFVGGKIALSNYINSKTGAKTLNNNVKVEFTISEKGKVKNAKLNVGANPELDEKALNIVREMPDWIPGKQRGKPVPVNYEIMIPF